jgi:YbbR domain-containing protein
MDKWLNNNSIVKATSLLLAIMLWMVVNNDRAPYVPSEGQQQIATREVALQARYDERKFVVNAPSAVQVELRGSQDLLAFNSLLTPGNYRVYIDLRHYGSGKYTVPVKIEGVPPGLTVQIQPKNVQVTIEELKKVEKNIRVTVVGKAQGAYKTGEPVINPQTVTVTVPESRVKDIVLIQALVNVEEANGPIDMTVPLRALDRQGRPINATIIPEVAEVKIPIVELPFKVVPLKIIRKGAPPPGYKVDSITAQPAQVTVYGPPEELAGLQYYPLVVDVSKISQSSTVRVNMPLRGGISRIEPPFVSAAVSVSQTGAAPPPTAAVPGDTAPPQTAKARMTEEVPIKVNGLAEGKAIEFTGPAAGKIKLELEGTEEALAGMDRSALQASIDVSNKPAGEYTVDVKVGVPPNVSLVNSPDNLRATVVIKEAVSNAQAKS